MKVGENLHVLADGQVAVENLYNYDSVLKTVAALRDQESTTATHNTQDHYRHVARIPVEMMYQWAREAGVDVNDREAVREIMHKKLMSGDVAKFRIWEGDY